MNIRMATLADIPACVAFGQHICAVTRYSRFQYDPQRTAQQLQQLIAVGQQQRGSHCVLLALPNEAGPDASPDAPQAPPPVAGLLMGCIESHLFSPERVASVINYAVLPGRRMSGAGMRLLGAFRRWAENRGAVEISLGINSGVQIERTDRFLRRLGFEHLGGHYSLRLSAS